MARGLNKVMIIGNLGQDPEVRFMPSGDPVANISVATTEQWTDKQSGQKQEKTEWHRCNAFGKLAEIMQQFLRKGSKVYIEGSLSTRKWTDQQGVDRYSTEIKVRDMQMLDSPNQGQQAPAQGGYQQQAPQQQGGYQQQPQQQPPQQQTQQQPPPQQQGHGTGPEGYQNHQAAHAQRQSNTPDPGSFDDFSDEIPF